MDFPGPDHSSPDRQTSSLLPYGIQYRVRSTSCDTDLILSVLIKSVATTFNAIVLFLEQLHPALSGLGISKAII